MYSETNAPIINNPVMLDRVIGGNPNGIGERVAVVGRRVRAVPTPYKNGQRKKDHYAQRVLR